MGSRSLSWPALVVLTAVALVVGSVAGADAQTPKRGGTLRVAYGNEISGLDFHTTPGYEMIWVATNVGCGLVTLAPDGKFAPDAAESWQASSDGLLYTFKLKKNVLFHDGTKLDAAAVKFNIDKIMDPAYGSSVRTFYEAVHSVEVVNPSTVQIRLKHPYAFMMHMLAAYRMGLVLFLQGGQRIPPWAGIIPPGTEDSADVTAACPYDPAKAKALLAEVDYQQVQGFALITAIAFVVINLLVHLTYTSLDPRIRYA